MSGDDSRMVKDPICGKDVDTLRARAVGIFGGVTYYFCSAECKAKYVDPRQAPRIEPAAVGALPLGLEGKAAERKGTEKRAEKKADKNGEKRANEERAAIAAGGEEQPIRYARSRMRRITGEVGAPVVQIDLSPSEKSAPSTSGVGEAEAMEEEPELPGARSRTWIVVALLVLMMAGAVLFFTMKRG